MNQLKEIIIPLPVMIKEKFIDRRNLPSEHPQSCYNYAKNILKVYPEDYGIYFINFDLEKLKKEIINEKSLRSRSN